MHSQWLYSKMNGVDARILKFSKNAQKILKMYIVLGYHL